MDLPATAASAARVSARAATSADVARITELHLDAIELLSPQRGGAHLVAERRRGSTRAVVAMSFDADISRESQAVLAGCIGDVVVGYSVLLLPDLDSENSDPENSDPATGEIRELFVETAAREIGVGAALIDAMRSAASAHGCDGVDATVLPGDRNTKNFFEDHSMAARAIVVNGPATS